jgi:co-chaperonin GroES (HSP10)
MKKSEIEMVRDNILVHVDLPKKETDAGIILSEEQAAQMRKDIVGKILAIGPEVVNLKEGDKILLPPHGNTPVSYKGEVYHVFREISIFAKVNG